MSPLTDRAMPLHSVETLTFKRITQGAVDARGDSADTLTTLGTVEGYIQPIDGDLKRGATASVEDAGEVTHHGFIRTRLSGIASKDVIDDSSGKRFLVLFVHDFKGSPQQFNLKAITDAEV